MRELYHGTIKQFVPSILKEGLSPNHLENRWNASKGGLFGGFNPAKEDPMGYVYVLDWRGYAADYAAAKARYFRAKPGEVFKTVNDVDFRKEPGAPVIPDAQPAVLKVTLPLNFPLEIDDKDSAGYTFKGLIPPEYIKLVSYADSLGVDNRTPEERAENEKRRAEYENSVNDAITMLLLQSILSKRGLKL